MRGLLVVKLVRDLRANWSRLVLMAVAIAISLTAFGAALFAWTASGRETRDAYASTEPASATILLDEAVDAERMAVVVAGARTRPGVVAATARTQFTGAVRVDGQPLDVPLQVFVATPDDPLGMARFFPDRRAWPPAADEVYLARDSLDLLGVAVGDTVTVELPAGVSAPLRIADTVYDPSLSPSAQEQTGRGYLSTASLGEARLDQVKIQVAEPGQTTPSRDRDAIVATAGDVGTWLREEHGLAIREIQVPEPYAHPHQWQADALLLSLLAGGAAALLLSAILVAAMLDNLFTRQIPQIGIMKAIGARSGRIGLLYLAMTFAVAVAATLLALAPGVLLGRLGVGTFLGFLGVTPAGLAAPWWTYLLVVVVGLALPPLMALLPLVKAARTTVRAAIDHSGVGPRPRATGLPARLGRGHRVDRVLLMALRNTVRRPARSWLAVGLLACAGTVFVAGMSLSAGVTAVTEEATAERDWDVDVRLAAAAPDRVAPVVQGVAGVERVEGFAVVPAGVSAAGGIPFTRTYPDQGHGRVAVTALPSDVTTVRVPELLEGRWLNPGETDAVVLNQVTREDNVPDVHAGDTVRLFVAGRVTTWRVVGIASERGHGSGVYATAEGLAAALGRPPLVDQLRVVTDAHDERTRQAVAEAVERSLAAAGFEVKSATSVSRREAVGSGHMGPVVLILLGIALPLGAVGLIGLASTMSSNVLDRIREFGIMRALGAQPKTVRRVVVAEGLFLAVTSCVVALGPALALTAVLGAGLGDLFFSAPLPYRISPLAVLAWSALVTLGAALATDAAATRASACPTSRARVSYVQDH